MTLVFLRLAYDLMTSNVMTPSDALISFGSSFEVVVLPYLQSTAVQYSRCLIIVPKTLLLCQKKGWHAWL